jgi:hypothetical protein
MDLRAVRAWGRELSRGGQHARSPGLRALSDPAPAHAPAGRVLPGRAASLRAAPWTARDTHRERPRTGRGSGLVLLGKDRLSM